MTAGASMGEQLELGVATHWGDEFDYKYECLLEITAANVAALLKSKFTWEDAALEAARGYVSPQEALDCVRALQLPQSPTPQQDQKSRRPVWFLQGLAGMFLVVAGMAILVASLIIRDGNRTGQMQTFPYAGLLTRILGTLVMVVGMALLGRGGMVRFGCVLMIGGAAAYLGNLLINHEVMGLANSLGGLAVLLGLILVAVANGWLGQQER
jgi:hypothetical protein